MSARRPLDIPDTPSVRAYRMWTIMHSTVAHQQCWSAQPEARGVARDTRHLPTAEPFHAGLDRTLIVSTINMLTVVETPEFVVWSKKVWTDSERESFVDWIAVNPDAGDVIPGSGGCR